MLLYFSEPKEEKDSSSSIFIGGNHHFYICCFENLLLQFFCKPKVRLCRVSFGSAVITCVLFTFFVLRNFFPLQLAYFRVL